MAYLLTTPLNDAWGVLGDREARLDIPIALYRSPQNPSAPFLAAYKAWGDLYESTLGARPDRSPLNVRELEQWTVKLQEMQALISRLEATYPQRAATTGGGTVRHEGDVNITGQFSWWYWPLRIGAGVGVGYVVYRGLRPKRGKVR